MQIEKLIQPINHEAFERFAFNFNPLLNPLPHLSQICDEMKEGFPCVLEERWKALSINNEPNIRRMVQNLKALHLDPASSYLLGTLPISWEKGPPGIPGTMKGVSSHPLLFHLLKKPFSWDKNPFVLPFGYFLHLVMGIDNKYEAILINFLEKGVGRHFHTERGR